MVVDYTPFYSLYIDAGIALALGMFGFGFILHGFKVVEILNKNYNIDKEAVEEPKKNRRKKNG